MRWASRSWPRPDVAPAASANTRIVSNPLSRALSATAAALRGTGSNARPRGPTRRAAMRLNKQYSRRCRKGVPQAARFAAHRPSDRPLVGAANKVRVSALRHELETGGLALGYHARVAEHAENLAINVTRSSHSATPRTGPARAARREGDRLCARDRASDALTRPLLPPADRYSDWARSHLGETCPASRFRRERWHRCARHGSPGEHPIPIETITITVAVE